MPFPAQPEFGQSAEQFLVQDPFNLRKQIFPVMTLHKETGFVTGLGTAFLADPFGTFLSAQHVLDDHFKEMASGRSPEGVAAVLYGMGLVYGTVGMPSTYFAPVTKYFAVQGREPDPLKTLIGDQYSDRIVVDCASFQVNSGNVPGTQPRSPLPIRYGGAAPRVGDRVMAIGFPELKSIQHDDPARALEFIERMYAAEGTVTAVLPTGQGATYPWPTIEVHADWRLGMSGGPVFNAGGEVIGLVSSGFDGGPDLMPVGYAVSFHAMNLGHWVRALVENAPGQFEGYGVVRNAPWHLAGFHPDLAGAQAQAAQLGSEYLARPGQHRYGADDFIG
jgi:serine protease Do